MLEEPCSGNIRHLILSKRALAQAEVIGLDNGSSPFVAQVVVILCGIRAGHLQCTQERQANDHRGHAAGGKAKAAARVAASLTLEEVMARIEVDPMRFGSTS